MLAFVMEHYHADTSGLTEKDCKEFLQTYQEYFNDALEQEAYSHFFGEKDHTRSDDMFKLMCENPDVKIDEGRWNIVATDWIEQRAQPGDWIIDEPEEPTTSEPTSP